jgi:UDP-N-acetylglucosamine--dolichyl-phosphate N-acetylglucosaminephosphotransferase
MQKGEMLELMILIISFLISLLFSFVSANLLIKWQHDKKILAKDMHKPGNWLTPPIGGPAILTGFLLGISVLIAYVVIYNINLNFVVIFSSIICLILLSYMGLIDDLFQLNSYWKFFLPLIPAVPLVAALIISNQTTMTLPFVGTYDFGFIYPLLLVPLAIVVASNLTNMLAGFNGIETGMGLMAFSGLVILSLITMNDDLAFLSFPALGSLLGFFILNKYPSKIFPGDSGTYFIGGAIAVSVIAGNAESFGAILMIPYGIDAIIKALNGFPKSFADYKQGKLYAPRNKIRGFADLVLKLANGMKEKDLSLFFIILEALFVILAFYIFLTKI